MDWTKDPPKQPLALIYGRAGSGLTSILARLVNYLRTRSESVGPVDIKVKVCERVSE